MARTRRSEPVGNRCFRACTYSTIRKHEATHGQSRLRRSGVPSYGTADLVQRPSTVKRPTIHTLSTSKNMLRTYWYKQQHYHHPYQLIVRTSNEFAGTALSCHMGNFAGGLICVYGTRIIVALLYQYPAVALRTAISAYLYRHKGIFRTESFYGKQSQQNSSASAFPPQPARGARDSHIHL